MAFCIVGKRDDQTEWMTRFVLQAWSHDEELDGQLRRCNDGDQSQSNAPNFWPEQLELDISWQAMPRLDAI